MQIKVKQWYPADLMDRIRKNLPAPMAQVKVLFDDGTEARAVINPTSEYPIDTWTSLPGKLVADRTSYHAEKIMVTSGEDFDIPDVDEEDTDFERPEDPAKLPAFYEHVFNTTMKVMDKVEAMADDGDFGIFEGIRLTSMLMARIDNYASQGCPEAVKCMERVRSSLRTRTQRRKVELIATE